MGHACQNYVSQAADRQFACWGHHTLKILLGQLSKPSSHSVLRECEEKPKPPWSSALNTFSHDSEKKCLAHTHTHTKPFGLFKNSIALSLCEDLKLTATRMP